MRIENQATRIRLRDFSTAPMRAFHMTWMAFFLCFFGWFGIAPLMALVRDEFGLTKQQVGNTIIASVAVTVLARLLVGWLCDRYGPRRVYSALLVVGAVPVMGIGLAQDYLSFLLFRLAIGAIGASFVITQHHTSLMFAPNTVGTANATTAGWGNLGGGVTQMVMPLLLAAFLALGFAPHSAWRLAMVLPGLALLAMGVAYWKLTRDTPDGDIVEVMRRRASAAGSQRESIPPATDDALEAAGASYPDARVPEPSGSFLSACKDYRVWALFLIYGACFGVELTINNIAALYYIDEFGLSLTTAGLVAGLFGLMNLFARTLGGYLGDRAGMRFGLRGRALLLGAVLAGEGLALMLFSQMAALSLAIGTMIVFSLFVQMSEGATFSVVPFINRRALGSVSGIVGAGGNAGAVSAGFLFRSEALTTREGLLYLGVMVACSSALALAVRFSASDEREAREDLERRLAEERGLAVVAA